MNRQESAKLVAVIVAATPNTSARLDSKRLTDMVDAFVSLLGDISYEQANRAVAVLLQTRPWMPAIADIRATVAEMQRGPIRSGGDAWGSVIKAISEQGVYREPGTDFVFRDPVTARCVASFGWTNLCNSENAIADRARFIELYDSLATQQRKEQLSPTLEAAREAREAKQLGEAIRDVLRLPSEKSEK